jgi:hypothetical protein
MQDWMKNTSPEEMQKQGAEMGEKMNAWTEKNKAHIVDNGLPLGKNTRITKDGAKQESNDLMMYTVVEAENAEAAAEMFKDSPHFMIPTGFIDIMAVSHPSAQ